MNTARRTPSMELFWKLHSFFHRISGGRIGGKIGSLPVLRLTIRGRKSGRARSVVLNYLEDAGGYVVFASHAGEDREPPWWLNLREAGVADAHIGSRRFHVRAREAQGDERERLWTRVKELAPAYAVYEQRTKRRIPVVLLEP